jgi:hypothetical protein
MACEATASGGPTVSHEINLQEVWISCTRGVPLPGERNGKGRFILPVDLVEPLSQSPSELGLDGK